MIKIVLPFVSLVIINSILVLKVLKDSAIAVLLPFVITMLEFFSPNGILPMYGRLKLSISFFAKKDIDNFNLPYIGNIPLGEKNSNIVITKGSKTAIAESFRTLRTNIEFMMTKDTKGKTIFITSTVAKEGKSFTAVNFSLSLAG